MPDFARLSRRFAARPRSAWRLSALVVALVAGLGLAGCATPPPRGPSHAEVTFQHLDRIPLKVDRVEITTRYIPPLASPHVEHRLRVPPYVAIRRWAEQRLDAVGGENWAQMVILDASITEIPLDVSTGLRGMFRRDQGARYDGRLAAVLQIRDPRGREVAFVRAEAERSQTVAEGASLAAREAVWFDMTETMMAELNRRLETGISTHLAPHLATGAVGR